MAEKCCYNRIFNKVLLGEEKMKTREDKRMVKLERKKKNSKLPFLNIHQKNRHIRFLMHNHSS